MTSHTTQAFKPESNANGGGLNIESLLSAPLVAAANANAMMQKEQLDFLMNYCFTKNEDSYKPIVIEMELQSSTDDDNASLSFEIPLLTLLPINSLSVEEVNIQFEMEITSQTSSQNNSQLGGNTKNNNTAKLHGKVSYDSKEQQANTSKRSYSKRNDAKLDVNIKAGNLPLPIGVTTILDTYIKAIKPKTKKTQND